MKVTAELGNEDIHVQEIGENLTDLLFIREKDNVTVVAEMLMKINVIMAPVQVWMWQET